MHAICIRRTNLDREAPSCAGPVAGSAQDACNTSARHRQQVEITPELAPQIAIAASRRSKTRSLPHANGGASATSSPAHRIRRHRSRSPPRIGITRSRHDCRSDVTFRVADPSWSMGRSNNRAWRGLGPLLIVAVVVAVTHPAGAAGRTSDEPVSFVVRARRISPNDWVVVALHPDAASIRITVSPTSTEVCPAAIDGAHLRHGWPSTKGKAACLRPRAGHTVPLPLTDGLSHVAFGIGSTSRITSVRVMVTYERADKFLMVIPPSDSDATVTFTPTSRTIGARAYALPDFSAPTGRELRVRQAGRLLISNDRPCDFGTELEHCMGEVHPGVPVTVALTRGDHHAPLVGMYLGWQ